MLQDSWASSRLRFSDAEKLFESILIIQNRVREREREGPGLSQD